MNILQCLCPAIILLVLCTAGCESTAIVKTSILDTQISGALTDIPVHVTSLATPYSVTVTPTCSVGPGKTLAGNVSGSAPERLQAFYPPDTVVAANGAKTLVRRTPGHNLHWSMPPVVLGVQADVAGTMSAWSFGAGFSQSDAGTGFGIQTGVGLFGVYRPLGFRVDAGICVERFSNRTSSIAVTKTESSFLGWVWNRSSDTVYDFDDVSQSRFGFYCSMTANTLFDQWPVNFVLQGALQYQSFFDYTPTRVEEAGLLYHYSSNCQVSLSSTFISLAPAVVAALARNIRIVCGARLLWPIEIEQPGMIAVPFARIDFVIPGGPNQAP